MRNRGDRTPTLRGKVSLPEGVAGNTTRQSLPSVTSLHRIFLARKFEEQLRDVLALRLIAPLAIEFQFSTDAIEGSTQHSQLLG